MVPPLDEVTEDLCGLGPAGVHHAPDTKTGVVIEEMGIGIGRQNHISRAVVLFDRTTMVSCATVLPA